MPLWQKLSLVPRSKCPSCLAEFKLSELLAPREGCRRHLVAPSVYGTESCPWTGELLWIPKLEGPRPWVGRPHAPSLPVLTPQPR